MTNLKSKKVCSFILVPFWFHSATILLLPVHFQSTSIQFPFCFQTASSLLKVCFQANSSCSQSTSNELPVYSYYTSSLLPVCSQSAPSALPLYNHYTSSLLPVCFQSASSLLFSVKGDICNLYISLCHTMPPPFENH